MSELIERANSLNQQISKANKESSDARARQKVLREQFEERLNAYGKKNNVDLLKVYKEDGLTAVQKVLASLYEERNSALQSEVNTASEVIAAYNQKDFQTIDRLLGVVPEVDDESPEEEVVLSEPEVVLIDAGTPAKQETEIGTEEDFKTLIADKTDSDSDSDADSDEGSSVFDAVAEIDGEDDEFTHKEPEIVQNAPDLNSILGNTMRARARVSEQKITDDEPKKSAKVGDQSPSKPVGNLFSDDEDDVSFGDMTLGSVIAASQNLGQK